MKAFDSKVLKPTGERVGATSNMASFPGIAGKLQSSTAIGSAPCCTGPVLGSVRCITKMLDGSYLPMLLSRHSMHELGFVLYTTTVCLYVPRSVAAARNRRANTIYFPLTQPVRRI